LLACKKDSDENSINGYQQWALVFNYTATWCSYCGIWGAPLMHDLNALSRVVPVSIHTNGDPMYTELMDDLASDRETGNSIPAFWIGDTKTNNQQESFDQVIALKAQLPVAGLNLSYEFEGNSIKVDVKTIFLKNLDGDFFLNIFLLEDGIDGSSSSGNYKQAGTSQSYPDDDYEHNFVLRTTQNEENVYGEQIISNPSSDETINKSYIINLNDNWEQQIYPVAVLWQYLPEGAKPHYIFINAIK